MVVIGLSLGELSRASRLVSSNMCQMDMRRPGSRKGQFRGAWCCGSLLHLPRAEHSNSLKEIHCVMEANGILGLTDQEDTGETRAEGDREGARRFFARYKNVKSRPLFQITALMFKNVK